MSVAIAFKKLDLRLSFGRNGEAFKVNAVGVVSAVESTGV
jgi:hypothetical protein